MANKLIWEENGVYIKLSSHLDYDEFFTVNNFLYGQKQFDTLQYQLWDFLEIESATNFEPENAEAISSLDKSSMKWNNKMKVAIVTTNSQIFDFASKYKSDTIDTEWDCSIFKSINEARTWLNSN